MKPPRDTSRAGVYSAEDQVIAVLDRGGVVDFHGSTFDVPRQRRFGDLTAASAYLNAVRRCSWGYSDTPAPNLRHRRGPGRAHWMAPDTIALPQDAAWAMTELVLLHEYAHHVNWHHNGSSGHDQGYRDIMLNLVAEALAPQVATLLLAAYHSAGAWGDNPATPTSAPTLT